MATYTIKINQVQCTVQPGPGAAELARAIAQAICVETRARVEVFSSERGDSTFAVYEPEEERRIVARKRR